MPNKSALRLDTSLIESAERKAAIYKRTMPKQIEYWAELGKAVEKTVTLEDAIAVREGIKKLVIEPVISERVDPKDVFNSLEIKRKSGRLAEEVTSSTVYYEPSLSHSGFLDKVDSTTGERKAGNFKNGKFIEKV